MIQPPCPRFDEISRAAGGPLPAELERHAAACRECADARLVDGFLRSAAAQQLAPPALPDAAAVRWRARLRARADRAERAVRPIALADKLGYAAGAAVLGALALGQGTPAAAWLRTLGEAAAAAPGAAPPASAATAAAAAMTPAALAVAAILLMAPPLLWGLYRSWADE
ncbi:MAG TPA: hypothetical protein VOA80_20980 [Thermoanaerobaculia bacterium]|nr:hypothetical protein [Thermoanaerobaculia bacterium]